MKYKECPNCKEQSISVVRVALLTRTACCHCYSRVGLHWLFGSFFAFFLAVFSGFFGIYLLGATHNGLYAFLILLPCIILVSLMVSIIGPLEVKSNWWTP